MTESFKKCSKTIINCKSTYSTKAVITMVQELILLKLYKILLHDYILVCLYILVANLCCYQS